MKSIKQIVLIVFAMTLAACSHDMSRGTKIDDSQLSQFQRGKTTYNDVIAAVGSPNSSTTMADGSRMITYSATTAHSNGGYIPFVQNPSYSAQSSIVTLRFGPDGILKDYSSSQHSMGN